MPPNAMPSPLPSLLNVVVVRAEPPETLDRIRAVAPERVRVTRVNERGDWDAQQDALLRAGHIALVGNGCPRDLHSHMPDLLWLHASFAGITDLSVCDFWGTGITMTSARGYTGALPIAEMALVGGMMIAKQLHFAARNHTTRTSGRDAYHQWGLGGKTVGVVGLGGIGGALANLAMGMGMRTLGTRRSATARASGTDGVDELFPPGELKAMAAQSDFLAVCSASTPETYGMVSAEVLDALPDGAIIMNVARGEIIDEEAMIARLESGKLGGAYLDVYADERNREPDPRLVKHPNVVMTPHVSDRSDSNHHFGLDVFCDNLRRFIDGEPLVNVVDWTRGY